jgi:hypothetical protein
MDLWRESWRERGCDHHDAHDNFIMEVRHPQFCVMICSYESRRKRYRDCAIASMLHPTHQLMNVCTYVRTCMASDILLFSF